MAEQDETPGVAGSASAAPRSGAPGGVNVTASMIEDAMTEAVQQCAREGITDDATILARKLLARSAVTGE
jgi:hypothetical protein